MKVSKKAINGALDTYYDWLLSKVSKWEDDILKDWFPEDDAWIGRVTVGMDDSEVTLESVRQLSEGLAYKQTPVFKSVSPPDLTKGWNLFNTLPE
jgi:hypothetical protein